MFSACLKIYKKTKMYITLGCVDGFLRTDGDGAVNSKGKQGEFSYRKIINVLQIRTVLCGLLVFVLYVRF